MDKFIQLFSDIAKLWTKYGESYISGMANTLILALIALACVVITGAIGGKLKEFYEFLNEKFPDGE